MTDNYIFCPFCGTTNWSIDRSGSFNGNALEYYKCQDCKDFSYTNIIERHESSIGLKYYSRNRFSVVSTIYPYIISIFYDKNSTQIQDYDSHEVILVLDHCVNFNWYKNEELVDKIRKYVLFS
jgi:hypothetical protein